MGEVVLEIKECFSKVDSSYLGVSRRRSYKVAQAVGCWSVLYGVMQEFRFHSQLQLQSRTVYPGYAQTTSKPRFSNICPSAEHLLSLQCPAKFTQHSNPLRTVTDCFGASLTTCNKYHHSITQSLNPYRRCSVRTKVKRKCYFRNSTSTR
jgi:hypothetical protein